MATVPEIARDRRASRPSRRHGQQYGNLGLIYETRGDIAAARRFWAKARDLFSQIGLPQMVQQVQGWLDGLGQLRDRRPSARA
jgi:Flp pilus assembly protein TadD